MSISKDEAARWLEGWKVLAEYQREEMRSTSIETRMTQLEALVASRDMFAPLRTEWDESVAERWARIRNAAGSR